MEFLAFDKFFESEKVTLERNLREYVLTHRGEDRFQLKSDDLLKDFSVSPYKSETVEKLKSIYNRLVNSIQTLDIKDLYSSIIEAESIPFDYGNIYPMKFSLKEVPELMTSLDDDQLNDLKKSPREFLLNNFSQLGKDIRDHIVDELHERAEVLCVVLEALFYYIRTKDKDNFYEGENTDEILEKYQGAIDNASKSVGFSANTPVSDPIKLTPINNESNKAYWKCEKNTKKFYIVGTLNIKTLYKEDSAGGIKGLKLSFTTENTTETHPDFSFFNIEELSKKIEIFYNKILKK
jgi:hypothetical protein